MEWSSEMCADMILGYSELYYFCYEEVIVWLGESWEATWKVNLGLRMSEEEG